MENLKVEEQEKVREKLKNRLNRSGFPKNLNKYLKEYNELDQGHKNLFWFVLDGFCGGNIKQALEETRKVD